MGIGTYLKDIGRGKQGARALNRAQAEDLFGQILDGLVTDLEIGAFCLAMRIKGETPEEMLGFLDATHARLQRVPHATDRPTVVIPSYNGARKLPVLTPLLALLLAREGFAVLLHGTPTEPARVFTLDVLQALGLAPMTALAPLVPGQVAFAPTALLCPALQRLLEVRRVVQLRNSAHSVVKLMQPCAGPQVLVTSYTHPEYAVSMGQTLAHMGAQALLLRGTEGEAVADARRSPRMQSFVHGAAQPVVEPQAGVLAELPALPQGPAAAATAQYIQAVLQGSVPVPAPIAQQVRAIAQLVHTL